MDLNEKALELGKGKHRRYPIQATSVEGYPGAGMGRVVRLAEPVPLTEIIDRIGLGLGNPRGFPIAVPQGKQVGDMMISNIGICAGSGGHLFSELDKAGEDVDLLFTGELSHHEALHQIERGRSVICLFHSNTERGFLSGVLKGQLEKAVNEEVSLDALTPSSYILTDCRTVGESAQRRASQRRLERGVHRGVERRAHRSSCQRAR